MKRKFKLLVVALSTQFFMQTSNAQTVDFSAEVLNANGYSIGPPSVFFRTIDGLNFTYFTDSAQTYFFGSVVSNNTDTITAGYLNQYSVFARNNVAGNKFGLAYFNTTIDAPNVSEEFRIDSISLTNNTYAVLDMQNGTPGISKVFGGITGNDSDYFFVRFTKLDSLDNKIDSIDFYLADYRFTNNAQDYIIKNWNNISLANLGFCKKIDISFHSSDVGFFGVNTPTYVCIDNLKYTLQLPVLLNNVSNESNLLMYPNPANSLLNTTANNTFLYNSIGKLVLASNKKSIDISILPKGFYTALLVNEFGKVEKQKLIIQ